MPGKRKRFGQRRQKIRPPAAGKIILFTGGLGDVLTLESHFSQELRNKVCIILYATSRRQPLMHMFSALGEVFPNLSQQITVWDDWSNRFDFGSKRDVIKALPNVPQYLRQAEDWSIHIKFKQIAAGHLRFGGSSLLKLKTAEIDKYGLPDDYVVVCPYTRDKRLADRDFNVDDWAACLKYLRQQGVRGVVINLGNDAVPEAPELINLANQTSVLEVVEVMKGAQGYIGIDTCWSVLAAQLFPSQRIAIKSVNPHCYGAQHIYFTPKKEFTFMNRSIAAIMQRPDMQAAVQGAPS